MSNSKAHIIKKRIDKLSNEDFDLEAWKETTFAILLKMLTDDDPRLEQINDLKVDYGSWALRDATSKYNPTETAKKKGREVLESIIDELEGSDITSVLREHLSASTFKKIEESSSQDSVLQVLKKEKKEDLALILSILTSQNL